MRRIFAILGMVMLGAVGCRHVGGKCDCGPQPGEATTYAPYHGYAGIPVGPVGPVAPATYEPIGDPKVMPKK